MSSQQPHASVPGGGGGTCGFRSGVGAVIATSHAELEQAALAEIGVVGELGDLEVADRDHAVVQRGRIRIDQTLELLGPYRVDAIDRLGGRDDLAEINRVAE